jgi:hypothetical protein
MPGKPPKKGMAEFLAEQREQVAAEPARPSRTVSAGIPASPARNAGDTEETPQAAGTALASDAQPPPAPSSASPGSSSSPGTSSKRARPGKTARLRSWYMTPASADALAQAIDDLHYATRAPKYEVLAAIIRAGLADLGPIEAELRAQQQTAGE